MGYVFKDLIRRFAEQSNETAGEHFTPREVIKLMVNVLFNGDSQALTQAGIVKTLYDPACGTEGMLSIAEQHLCGKDTGMNPGAKLEVFGLEINPESYAICKSDMLIKGQNPTNKGIGLITKLYGDFVENECVKILPNAFFGYWRDQGRTAGCPAAPFQIPACGILAQGSSISFTSYKSLVNSSNRLFWDAEF